LYQNSLQPNIQVTAVDISTIKNPNDSVVVNLGRVYDSGKFSYTAEQAGTYVLVFTNIYNILMPYSKRVSVTYSVDGKSYTQSFEIREYFAIPLKLTKGQSTSGSFTVRGGFNNDVDFYIEAHTGTQSLTFSFTLVNSGVANGFAVVVLQADGKEIWSNRYFVQAGQQVDVSGKAILPDLDEHDLKIEVAQQQKA